MATFGRINKENMYQITTAGRTFDVELNRNVDSGKINGNDFALDIMRQTDTLMHVLHKNKGYNVHIEKVDTTTKTVHLTINGAAYEVKAKDDFDLLLEKLGMSTLNNTKINNIKAPMPGLVLDIMVAPGQEVDKDTPLLILEAMKMENVLKSPTEGIVKSITVEKGQAVEKNTVLINFQ